MTSDTHLWSAEAEGTKLKFADLPAPVQKTFQEEAPQVKFESVTEVTEDGKTVYLGYALLDQRNYGIRVAKDGTLVGKVLETGVKVIEVEIKLADAPAAVQKILKAETKTGTIDTVVKTIADGKTLYGASATLKNKPYWITVFEDGTLVEKRLDTPAEEVEIELTKCPAAVRKLLAEEGEGGKIVTVTKVSEGDKAVYRLAVMLGDKTYSIMAEPDGTLLDKKLEIEPERAVVRFAECPSAVQKTLQTEAKGSEIEIVSKETEDGNAIFTTEVKIAGKTYEIQVAEDGRLIYKMLSSEPELGNSR